jgi:signal transduction histidine kinase
MEDQDARDLRRVGGGRDYAEGVALAVPDWLRRPSERTRDFALLALVGVAVVGSTISNGAHHGEWWPGLVAAVAIAPLLLRRKHPVAALAAIVLLGLAVRENGVLTVVTVPALYTIAAFRPGRVSAIGVAAILAAVLAHRLLWGQTIHVPDVLGSLVLSGGAVAFGLAAATRRTSMDALRERAERLDSERELLAERAVTEERFRLARERHDVVAHNVSLMVVQAQALGATASDEGVTEATDGIADLGRQAMAEMHRTLTVLRSRDGQEAVREPQPRLADIETLIGQSRAAGLAVELSIEGAPRELSPGLELSAFRIVQEALTNVRKHAGATRAWVGLAFREDAVAVSVRNAGRRESGASAGRNGVGGHGIAGMRERAAMFGGTLTAEPLGADGFEVRAILPYVSEPTE